MSRGLYLHVPFCLSKCTYCDFYSVASDTETKEFYAKALCKEIARTAEKYGDETIDTIYIGGGTPSIMPVPLLDRIINTVYKSFKTDLKEFTIEVNPCSADSLADYRSMGVDRISMGVQTLNDNILRLIGRRHTSTTAIEALERANKYFDKISADLIIGLPTQTLEDCTYATKRLAPLAKHFSVYMLKLSEGVPMAKALKRGDFRLPDDDTTVDMYDAVYSLLRKSGFARYEISNFARVGYESLHNLKYWHREEYLGLGAAAHGFIGNVRYDNPAGLVDYFEGANFGEGRANAYVVDSKSALFEYIMLALRLPEGISIAEVNAKFGIDFEEKYASVLGKLTPVLRFDNGRVSIREDKLLLESAVAVEFLD